MKTQARAEEVIAGNREALKINIITSCTGRKRANAPNPLTQDDFRSIHDREIFSKLEDPLADFRTFARDLYTGDQHLRLMQGIRYFRERRPMDKIELWIVSAGYGIVAEEQKIVPYECTFQGMKVSQLREWSEHLSVPSRARDLFAQPADLTLVLLSESYLSALALDDAVQYLAPTFFLTGRKSASYVRGRGVVTSTILSHAEASRFSCGLVGLKGEVAKRLLEFLAEFSEAGLAKILDSPSDLLGLIEKSRVSPSS